MGIRIEKKNSEWLYIIPKEIQLPGDDEKTVVKHTVEANKEGNYVYTQKTSQNLKFSYDNDGEYEIIFSSATGKTPTVVQDVRQTINLRENDKDLASQSFASMLYNIGHPRADKKMSERYAKKFDELVRLLARQDFPEAEKFLTSMSKERHGYPTLAKKLLLQKKSMPDWTSYMYGTRASKADEVITQKSADKNVRTNATIAAENKLAEKEKIFVSSNEAKLRVL